MSLILATRTAVTSSDTGSTAGSTVEKSTRAREHSRNPREEHPRQRLVRAYLVPVMVCSRVTAFRPRVSALRGRASGHGLRAQLCGVTCERSWLTLTGFMGSLSDKPQRLGA